MAAVAGRCRVLIALTVCVACMSAENGGQETVGDSAQLGALDVEALVDVTPQIPDGPVVQQFNKMVAKKKMSAELERQRIEMGPKMDSEDAKAKAKKRELEMMAEVVVKGRVAKKEMRLKREAKAKEEQDHARAKIAEERRTERYVKLNEGAVQREQERLSKLHKHTHKAFSVIKKLFKRKASTKKTAMVAMATAEAQQKAELTVGGYLNLKGNQINMPSLVNLNEKLAEAMKEPTAMNIEFAQNAFKRAALGVTEEETKAAEKEVGWKSEEKANQEQVEKREHKIHKEKIDKLAAKVAAEKVNKKDRSGELIEKKQANEAQEKKKWVDAVAEVKKQRLLVTSQEEKAKKDFVDGIAAKEVAKKKAAPGELVASRKEKFTERSEKYDSASNSGEAAKAVAKIMKRRACEALKAAENALENQGTVPSESAVKAKEAADTKYCNA